MITIKVRPHHITVSGHANFAPRGRDIVCAAVSTLTDTLLSSLEQLAQETFTYSISPSGAVDIDYGDLSERGALLVDSFFLGVCRVRADFPEHITIT